MTRPRPQLEDISAGPVRAAPGSATVRWVCNHDDERATVRYLAGVAIYSINARHAAAATYRPVVLRPTPGGGDHASVALDLLIALGKSPDMLRAEQLRGEAAWMTARAWMTALDITHLIVDRAQELPDDRLIELAGLAAVVGAEAWMVWADLDLSSDADAIRALRTAGCPVERYWPQAMTRTLPPPHIATYLSLPDRGPANWRRLPAVDFPTFRAACRRRLGRDEFTHVDTLYRDAARRTEQWLELHTDVSLPIPPRLEQLAAASVGWLRDAQLGPAPSPAAALIALRGTQAALFTAGILMRWIPDALGPDPAARLPGTLTGIVAGALHTVGRTGDAAATVLSLHLNQSPRHFTCFRIGDVTDDASRITAHQHEPAPQLHPVTGRVLASPRGDRETTCDNGVGVPERARPFLRAHLAYRRLLGATGEQPLFASPTNPEQHLGPHALHNAVSRVCTRLNLTPNWLHPSTCRYGADIGLADRAQGWLIERGLSLHQLDPQLAALRHRHADEP